MHTPLIPVFPESRKVTIQDKHFIKSFSIAYPPYSDFNFTSMWSYNTDEDFTISQLHTNLVIKFRDYITNDYFYSFIGTNKIIATSDILLKQATIENIVPHLKLIPHTTIVAEPQLHHHFKVEEDHDNHDYILDLESYTQLSGSHYKQKRKNISRFKLRHPDHEIHVLDPKDRLVQTHILELFETWENKKCKTREETAHELRAIKRVLSHASEFDLIVTGIFHKKKLVGFAINEGIHNKHAISHFMKTDPEYDGLFDYLDNVATTYLHNQGYTHFNIEQDLGIPGLKKSKLACRPSHFLKKYKITFR